MGLKAGWIVKAVEVLFFLTIYGGEGYNDYE